MRREAHTPMLTPTQVLHRHWLELIQETSMTEQRFAAELREHHEMSYPKHARTVEWSNHADPTVLMKRDAEKIARWFSPDATARFPIEVIESFVAAFPEYRRRSLQIELAARQGLLAPRIPSATTNGDDDMANLGRMGKKSGEAIMEVSQLLADGEINRKDRKQAPRALTVIEGAIATLVEMRERIKRQAMVVCGVKNDEAA